MVWSHIPFALFPIVDLDIDIINSTLDFAFKGTDPVSAFLLAPESYDDLPTHTSGKLHQGSKTPISSGYKSPWVDKKIDDIAEWMRDAPREKDIDHNFFAVLDQSAKDGKIVICRVGGKDLKDMSDVDWMRYSAEEGALKLRVAQPGDWEQEKERKGDDGIQY